MFQGEAHGLGIYGNGWRAVDRHLWFSKGLRPAAGTQPREPIMSSGWMILAAVLAAGLLVYLVAVLLRPEDFS